MGMDPAGATLDPSQQEPVSAGMALGPAGTTLDPSQLEPVPAGMVYSSRWIVPIPAELEAVKLSFQLDLELGWVSSDHMSIG